MMRFSHWVLLVGAGLVGLGACTNDYDSFGFGSGGKSGSGGASGGTGGSDGGITGGTGGAVSGGTGGAVTGGTGGAVTGGTGGAVTGGTGGTATGGTGGTATGGTGGGCGPNQKLCNGSCVSTTDVQFGCAAASCAPCAPANAVATCSQGQCAIGTCTDGFGDCDNSADNGCETSLATTSDCGSCGRACSNDHSSSAECHQGACRHLCDAGWGDCNQPTTGPDDGCETNLTSTADCGTCGNDCGQQGASGGFVCVSGQCGCGVSAQCGGGSNGVCDTTSGICTCSGNVCNPGERCSGGGNPTCRCNSNSACQSGDTCCPSAGCKNLMQDDANCGACGKACPGGSQCQNGSCA
jgi:hypothetical protein